MKVYGPSLAMIDDWDQRIAQLGLTSTTYEYVIYQLLATAVEWSMWKIFLPGKKRPKWETHDWPVTPEYVSLLLCLRLPLSLSCCFSSVQRLHGFRQVVQHVQLHVAK